MAHTPHNVNNLAMHHVITRGNFKQNIFSDRNDYAYYTTLLAKTTQRYNCKIHLYCLMSNHTHLVVESHSFPLSKIMQSINSTYARYINKKLERQGHVFQGRYHAKRVYTNEYLVELCYYIHMNPLRACIVETLEDYPWSSHKTYAGTFIQSWVSTDYIKIILEKSPDLPHSYNTFMEDYKKSTNHIVIPPYEIPKNTTKKQRILNLSHFSVIEITKLVCECLNISLKLLVSRNKQHYLVFARGMATYYAHYHGQHTLNTIAKVLARKPKSLSKTIRQVIISERYKKLLLHWQPIIEQAFWQSLLNLNLPKHLYRWNDVD